ncbi:MAG: RidA family protein [Nitratireductor sp.]|nr:RidA family protein [Nitratireductor sp.]
MVHKALYLPGAPHKNPVPAVSIAGNILCSGVISGKDAQGDLPEGLDAQVDRMFDNLVQVVEHAGASMGDIVRLNLWLVDPADRRAINARWLALFPDPGHQPSRVSMPAHLDGGKLVQCDFMAVLGGSRDEGQ